MPTPLEGQARFYEIARSSAEELKSLMCLSLRFGYVEHDPFDAAMGRLDQACRLVFGLEEAQESLRLVPCSWSLVLGPGPQRTKSTIFSPSAL